MSATLAIHTYKMIHVFLVLILVNMHAKKIENLATTNGKLKFQTSNDVTYKVLEYSLKKST